MSPAGRSLLFLALGTWSVIAVLLFLPGLVLFASAETLSGRLFGAAALLSTALPYLAGLGFMRGQWRPTRWALAAIILLGAIVLARAPTGELTETTGSSSVFLGSSGHPRYSIGNLVPEIDQIKTGTYLVPFVDPIMTTSQGEHLRALSMPLYRAIEADPRWSELGSVMPYAYADVDVEHLYQSVPTHTGTTTLPLVIYVHGSGGNFTSYLRLWARFAEEQQVVVVQPSFGFGNWSKRGGVEAILRARRYAERSLPIDPGRVYLVGLSNGGLGVTRAVEASPGQWAGVVYLSAVVEPERFRSRPGVWRGLDVLLIHGAQDDRIPLPYAEEAEDQLSAAGAATSLEVIEGEDHFLFFSKAERVLGDVARFVKRRPTQP